MYTTSKGNKVVSMRFSKELTEKLEAEARMRGVSVSKLCKKIVGERFGERVATRDYLEGFRQARAWQEAVKQEAVREEPVMQEPVKPPPEGERRITRVVFRGDQGEHPGMHQE